MPSRLAFRRKPETQDVQGQRLPVLQAPARLCAGALSHPGFGSPLRDDSEESVTDLRKQMDVLVTVDEIRRSPEHLDKRTELGRDFSDQQFRLKATRNGTAQDVVE